MRQATIDIHASALCDVLPILTSGLTIIGSVFSTERGVVRLLVQGNSIPEGAKHVTCRVSKSTEGQKITLQMSFEAAQP